MQSIIYDNLRNQNSSHLFINIKERERDENILCHSEFDIMIHSSIEKIFILIRMTIAPQHNVHPREFMWSKQLTTFNLIQKYIPKIRAKYKYNTYVCKCMSVNLKILTHRIYLHNNREKIGTKFSKVKNSRTFI